MEIVRHSQGAIWTPVLTYEKDDSRATLIGGIHIAQAPYYSQLEELIGSIPSGFYERIVPSGDTSMVPPEKMKYLGVMKSLGKLYRTMADWVDGEVQYQGNLTNLLSNPQWVNSDVSLEEYVCDMPEEELEQDIETAETFNTRFPKWLLKVHERRQKELATVLTYLGVGLAGLALRYLNTGGESEAEDAGDHASLTQRNERLFDTLEHQPLAGHFGIFYGCDHLPPIDEYLAGKGYVLRGTEWLPAFRKAGLSSFAKSVGACLKALR